MSEIELHNRARSEHGHRNLDAACGAPCALPAVARPKRKYSADQLILSAVGAVALAIVSPPPAEAGSLLTNFRSTSTSINAGALTIGGSYQFDQFNQADPWVAQVYAEAGDCLRIDVFTQDTDLEAVLISPSGVVWRNDDRNGTLDRRPLIKAQGTGRGWHVLQISKFDGAGPGANFRFFYGRYPAGNPNCATPTVPTAAVLGEAPEK